VHAEVRRLGLINPVIEAEAEYASAGALVTWLSRGTIRNCYAEGGQVSAGWGAGGLAAGLGGASSGSVASDPSRIVNCYSTCTVRGDPRCSGGLVGGHYDGEVADCFWDVQTSGHATSAGGTGKTTAELQTARTFLDAGWDFVGETANGSEDIWWIDEGKDYPRLARELSEEAEPNP